MLYKIWNIEAGKMQYKKDYNFVSEEDHLFLVEPTDYTDYNNIAIYDGDILKHPSGQKFVVQWNSHFHDFRAYYEGGDDNHPSNIALQVGDKGRAVIIGNIFENPELFDFDKKSVKIKKRMNIKKLVLLGYGAITAIFIFAFLLFTVSLFLGLFFDYKIIPVLWSRIGVIIAFFSITCLLNLIRKEIDKYE